MQTFESKPNIRQIMDYWYLNSSKAKSYIKQMNWKVCFSQFKYLVLISVMHIKSIFCYRFW